MLSPLMKLTDPEKILLLSLSRETLENFLQNEPKTFSEIRIRYQPIPEACLEPHPCFVTLTTVDDRLRGCIGCTETHKPLFENVHEYTLCAANRDPRFAPIEKKELGLIVIEITVLGELKRASSLNDIQIGKHGLCVRSGGQSGLLLAQVAKKYGLDAERFVEHTCRKAGLDPGKKDEYDLFYFEESCFSEKR